MNIFRLLSDLSRLLAIIILLRTIWKTRSCAGISGKSQILFSIVYTTRYLDLLTTYVSTYNTVMKVVYTVASYATVYLMYVKFKGTYDQNHDTFRIEFLLVPCLILALLINREFTVLEVLWTFSIYLDAVAILPQLFLVSKTGEAESITSHYLFALGFYRGLNHLNWIFRYIVEDYYELIPIIAGVVQTVLYCDFFYLYITKVLPSYWNREHVTYFLYKNYLLFCEMVWQKYQDIKFQKRWDYIPPMLLCSLFLRDYGSFSYASIFILASFSRSHQGALLPSKALVLKPGGVNTSHLYLLPTLAI